MAAGVLICPPALLATLSPPPTATTTAPDCPALQSDWGYSLGSNNWQGPSGYINGKKIDPLMGSNWENKPNLEAAAAGVKKD